MMTSLLSRIAIAATGLTLISCGPTNIITKTPPTAQKAEHVLYQWYDDAGPGEVKVLIKLSEQQAFFTRGGRDIGWCFVATGKEGHGTPAGTYKITEKIVDKHSNRYGWIEDEWGNVTNGDATPRTKVPPGERYVPAPMPYWMRLTSYGIGMHAGVIPKPGETASHGCIRLPKDFAPVLHHAVKVGTPVTISY
ncbi:L,D-transpeptidase family protein [Luteolibacter flavescens]|uniref:L,D-transpeptidase family protein n=1 Tax=Luteolibacter flavescens TaxID=1859460 RepID=A0ABT3FMP6_9BACT|nr:L,D-transpeptidase family protein [Luteolibacter flavescens]MCW1884847.1 L,D-transpeptidase family protein [Luteolibacter flavescens]